jgi:hypothetical protein
MRRICWSAGSVLFAAILPIGALGQGNVTEGLCGKAKGTPEAIQAGVAKDPQVKEMRRSEVFVALENGSDGTLWTFTLPAHPAHPAVICRRIMERRGVLEIPMTVQCSGAEAACAKLRSDFDVLNERMILDLYQKKK